MVSFIQAQWDICDQRNHQTYYYLVKGYHLYNVKLHDRASFFSFILRSLCLSYTNKGTSRREEEHSLHPVCFHKIRSVPPSTRYLYLRWPFFMKHSWTNSLYLSSSLEWGIVVLREVKWLNVIEGGEVPRLYVLFKVLQNPHRQI